MLCKVAPLFAVAVISTGAFAQTAAPSPQAPASSPAATSTLAAPPAESAAPAAPEPAGALSESKFLSQLYAEIARHTPAKSPAGAGEVKASFHVNPQGKIEKVVIEKTSSPALAAAVKKILAAVQAPPPPAQGDPDITQTFRFH